MNKGTHFIGQPMFGQLFKQILMKKKLLILIVTYILGGIFLLFTPGYSWKVTKWYFKNKLDEIETFVNYIEYNNIFSNANEDLHSFVLSEDGKIKAHGKKQDFSASISDTLSVDYLNIVQYTGVDSKQMFTIMRNFRRLGVKGVIIGHGHQSNQHNYRFLLYRWCSYWVMSEMKKKQGLVSRPLDDSRIGSRMQPMEERLGQLDVFPTIVWMLYPYL